MTPEQAELIRKSFDAMWPMRRNLADSCYSRLFELAPEARAMFSGDMERQRLKLMDMIAALVGALDQRDLFQSLISRSGRQHAGFGVKSVAICRIRRGADLEHGAAFRPGVYAGAAGGLGSALRRRAR